MGILTPKRVDQPELLDEHDAPAGDVERSLQDLRRINRLLGGVAIYRRLVRRVGAPEQMSVLDVGTGTGDLLESLPGDGSRTGIDFKIEHLLRTPRRVRRVVGDARALPFRDGSFDLVTSAHFFHHFTPAENVEILDESLRVARRAVAVNDTRRAWPPLLFIRLVSALRLVGRITRFDGPASVLRGYTHAEAREVAASTAAARHEVLGLFPYRIGILLWKRLDGEADRAR